MSFPIIEQYKQKYPSHVNLLNDFQPYYHQKLWYELSRGVLIFIYQNDVKGKLSFEFYTDFIKHFDKNIDQISHLKMLKECLANVSADRAIAFLEEFQEKSAFTDENKAIAAGLRANYYVNHDFVKCSEMYHRLDKFVHERKDLDPFTCSTFYFFATNYYFEKKKQKSFYDNALQYLAYTPAGEIQNKVKIQLLANMGIAVLASPEIYNFSELLEQPMLVSLSDSEYQWVYQLLVIFNNGDIETYNTVINDAISRNTKLEENKKSLDQKIRLMALLELAFNLPKSNRTVSFEKLAKVCSVPAEHVEFMVMKAAALNLVKVQINQLNNQVSITWVAPKVLGADRIGIMMNKFEEWQTGVEEVKGFITEKRSIEA